MRVAVIARDEDDQEDISYRVNKRFKLVKKRPYVVVSVGGDGTLLIAERLFPGVPKLMIKDSDVCNSCIGYDHPADKLLETLQEKYSVKEHPKLDAQWLRKGRKKGVFTCTNDFIIRNQLPMQALRFQLFINEESVLADELIGDGAVICTAFGSGGYYQSITKKSFEEGIGVGLNNCTIQERGIHTSREKTIRIVITRMPADFAVDNDPDIHTLEPGDEIIVTASAEKMRMIEVEE